MTAVFLHGIVVDTQTADYTYTVSKCIFPDMSGEKEKWFCLEMVLSIHLFGGFYSISVII